MSNLAYVPPGVTVQELTSTSLTPLLAVPGSVCLVGLAQGFIQQTDQMQLFGTTATPIPRVPSTASMAAGAILSVIDATNPAIAPNGYLVGTQVGTAPSPVGAAYSFNSTNHTITRLVTTNTLASGA